MLFNVNTLAYDDNDSTDNTDRNVSVENVDIDLAINCLSLKVVVLSKYLVELQVTTIDNLLFSNL